MTDTLPSKEAVLSVMQLTERTPEAAEYLYDRFKKILNGRLPEVLVAIKNFCETVNTQFSLQGNPMAGERIVTPAESLELALAAPEPESISPAAQRIDLDVQIADNSRMERRYEVNDNPIEPKTREYLDGLMKRWIAKSDMVRENHIMYEVPLKQDELGQPIPISPEKLKEKIENPAEGINAYISQESKGKCQINLLNVARIATPPEPTAQSETKMGGG